MRFTHSALLLALCQLASSSPCKPSSSVTSNAPTSTDDESATSATETSTAISVETGSSTVSNDATLTASEAASTSDLSISTTLVSTSSAEPTTTLEATTDLSTTVDETTTTFESETTSDSATLVSTTTAEASTTTSAAPEIPSNRVLNPGFEDTLVYPWESMSGTLSRTSSEVHSGSQSGFYSGNTPMSAIQGIRQFIDPTWITPGKSYRFSAWVKITNTAGCGSRTVVCGHGVGQGTTGLGGTITENGDFSLASVTCSWTQAEWEARPSVQIRSYCTGLSFFVDDAALEEVETLG
ncbi:uncharacterized protein FMAN_12244 [Fusarium mangiferae]|uniref:CBM-cenC domain-containing protein n=1 Tax=Fusarium mangiferae TaxID=192010 RepID=A0A1L7THK4_FUSMA|nr:uncharacterized protein FMAN_12244 [Fusarium mangiferae]CVK98170.1 uncharacterized protein FMAN_12244 [Fusarium mangiferae]